MAVYEYEGKRGISYYYKFTIRGKVYKKSVPEARTKRQAEHVEMLARQAVFDNKYMRFIGTMMFKDFVEKIYLPWATHKKSYEMERWYCQMLTTHPLLKDKALGDISQILIEQFRSSRKTVTRRGVTRSLATINREVACLSKILGLAVDNGHLDRNPSRLVPAYRVDSRRTRVMSEEEDLIMLAEACQGLHARVFPVAVLARYAGMRRGEILRLHSDHADFSAGLLRLPGEITKNGTGRDIPMTGLVREVLEERGRGLLFEGYPSKQRVSSLFLAAMVKCGVEGVTLHICRHTFDTRLADYGVHNKEIRDLMGHRPKDMTEHYQHSTPESRRLAMETLEARDPLAKGTKYVQQMWKERRPGVATGLKSTG